MQAKTHHLPSPGSPCSCSSQMCTMCSAWSLHTSQSSLTQSTKCTTLSNTQFPFAYMQVDDFELAEETPEKAPPSYSKARTPVAASPDAPEPQARLSRPPASAERRTAEWVTALSPVIEHDELSPCGQPSVQDAADSPAATGELELPSLRNGPSRIGNTVTALLCLLTCMKMVCCRLEDLQCASAASIMRHSQGRDG